MRIAAVSGTGDLTPGDRTGVMAAWVAILAVGGFLFWATVHGPGPRRRS